ncbi:MAG: glucokinase [Bacteroidetes bacterium GWF2_38_335]|nr:MAG: glucokinase [Bacteroidetes bacterium GWF2_38_335]OFY76906.1 MAG: glucokinase [Bacteroidetes bacterium RIFOXYA12_FULL_38_20]HBS86755.1 glucokinase [Bacteroidales bacterium]
MKEIAAGVDIGGTNIVTGLLEKDGSIVYCSSLKTKDLSTPQALVKAISEEITKGLEKGDYTLRGIGIGAPTANSKTGKIEFSANLPWKEEVDFPSLFKSFFNAPVTVANDANAAAIGEMIYGKAKGMRDFILITLGTGLGSGIISNGELVTGYDSYAGEIGHTIIEINGRKCGCGRKGCLETYVSATGIKRTAVEMLESKMPSLLENEPIENVGAKMICEAAMKGDRLALTAFEITAQYLGLALANSVAYTSPEAIFLFGGLSNAGDLLLVPTKKYMEENLLHLYKNRVKLEVSGLNEQNAAILGASALVWK